ncbi:NACHT domain-containing protein [Streptomyces pseudovenezuelae]|uniref:Energy-coupling factor transporter ATP-binding protein EcfA2 n=1 Tax=Streptomyces pseudovenezuelae TaxID=67350 RepID=A0ABT6LE11_9ACTN|nr:NACHT domain-containing protein [Streptomyces pseudovenezuelae]MDH6214552.1 energy-coupling factor transporter ATP-binding protein EcfA2 [Streptomyces pseudovenezuelae]
MDPTVIGTRLASSLIGPLVKKLFAREGPGADLVDKPVRLSALVSFRGERRSLGERELRKLVRELVDRAARETREAPLDAAELAAVADALRRTLLALGDLDLDDMQAVRLGYEALADRLFAEAGGDDLLRLLSYDSTFLYFHLLNSACLHILHFFTQRSAFVARTLVEQSRRLDELIRLTDVLVERLTSRTAQDAVFEQQYARYIATRHSHLTIYGIDLDECREWPLDTAYLSLVATREAEPFAAAGDPLDPAGPERRLPAAPQPVERALAGHERVLLRGVAGSGKTTLVQWLAVTTARQEELTGQLAHLMGRIPFVLPLRTLTRAGAHLPVPGDFLKAVSCPLAGSQPPGWADRVLTAGRGLLLIDGIDEVPEQERARTRRWLADLLAAFPGNLWLVTSRPSAVRDDWLAGDGFTELTLSPMSRENVTVFVRRWHEAAEAEPSLAEALLNAVRTKQDLGRLATNPLMCALICALHRERRGFLPRGRKALYDAALSMLLERRDRERDLAVELDEESQIELLQRLAYWLIRNGRAEMSRSDAVHQLDRLLPSMPYVAAQGSAEEILRHLLVRSGLLREPAVDAVDFVHRTFQDYLGARAAVEERDFDALIAHAHLDQWEDVLRMAVAHARPDERARLLTGLMERGDLEEQYRARLHLLAMACLEHAAKLEPGVREEVERRAGELIPPRHPDVVQKLVDIGPLALELLPGPENVDDDEAAAGVVHTAGLIGGDAALLYLTRYRNHRATIVQEYLSFHWDKFDTETYGDEIVRHLLSSPTATLYLRTPEQLAALRRMGGYNRVDLVGDFGRDLIRECFDETRLETLSLADNSISDLTFLTPYQELRLLYLQSCANLISLAPLKQLPLESLGLMNLPGIQDLDVLYELNLLSTLRLGPAEVTGLASTGIRLENLRHVSLTGDASPAQLRSVVTAFPRMVSLRVLSGTQLDLTPLAAHQHLRRVTTPPDCRLLNADRLPNSIQLNPEP